MSDIPNPMTRHEEDTTHIARFLDEMPEEYENLWRDIDSAVIWTERREVLGAIWADESLPPVFRDRAMLRLLSVPNEQIFAGGNSGTHTIRNYQQHGLEGNDVRSIPAWLLELLSYQAGKDTKLLAEKYAFNLATVLYDMDLMSDEELGRLIEVIGIYNAAPRALDEYEVGAGGWGSGQYDVAWKAFPVVEPIFAGHTIYIKKSGKLRHWAMDQAIAWVNLQQGLKTADDVPDWLQDIGPEQGLALFRWLIASYAEDKEESSVSWDSLEAAIAYFGDDVFLSDRGVELLHSSRISSRDIQLRMITAMLRYNAKLEPGNERVRVFDDKELELFQMYVDTSDENFKQMVLAERRRRQEKLEKDRKLKEKIDAELGEDPHFAEARLARVAAAEALPGLLERLHALGNKS